MVKDKSRINKTQIAGLVVKKTTFPPPKDLRSYVDSGATCHRFHSEFAFVPGSLTPCNMRTVMLADKTSVTSTQMDEVIIPFEHANICLQNVPFITNLDYNLVPTAKFAAHGIKLLFRRTNVRLGPEKPASLSD